MGRSPDTYRRVLGGICLAVSAAMLILGETVFKARLEGQAFIYYWLGCMVLTFATLVIALLDLRAVRLRSRREQTKLIEEALRAIARERDKDKAGAGGEGE